MCFPEVNGRRTTRKIGKLIDFNQEQADARAHEIVYRLKHKTEVIVPTVEMVAKQYRDEKLSKLRHSTRKSAESWLKCHILPRWGKTPISELEPRPVELWIDSCNLAPRTRGHLRELLHRLVDFSMWARLIPDGLNPIRLVTVRGSSKRRKRPRSLTVQEFQLLLKHLTGPLRTMAQLQVCLGLRVSELLALRWKDVDWISSRLHIEHGIVMQHFDDVKTDGSRGTKFLDPALLAILAAWKQVTDFNEMDDWIFASPVKLGRLPISYTCYKTALQTAAKEIGIAGIGTHSLRHTYRSWLDAVGTPLTVQQKLMRHTDIRTTLNVYGDVVTNEMQDAETKIAGLALEPDSRMISGSAND